MPTHNKLVRDRIPEFIESTGKKFSTRILNDEEYITELKKKSYEELQEYMEVTDLTMLLRNWQIYWKSCMLWQSTMVRHMEEVERVRQEKAVKRGGFKEKIFLIDVEEEK